MNGIASNAVSSINYILFRLLENNEVCNDVMELEVRPIGEGNVPDKFILDAIHDHFHSIIRLIEYAEDGIPELEDEVKKIRKTLISSLAEIDSLNDKHYLNRLNKFINSYYPDPCTKAFFEEVIQKAKERKAYHDKFLEDPGAFPGRFTKFIEQVENIYQEANGEPENKPELPCPLCNNLVNTYGCAWGYNNHVHFYCDHCGMEMME